MKTVSMSGSLRANVGKKDAKALRREEKVPCVLYGAKEQIHFSLEAKPLGKLIYTPDVHFVELNVDGKKYNTIIQDIQFHPVSDNIYHVDFLELQDDKKVTMNIPVHLSGDSPGVIRGGKLVFKMKKLKIKAFPNDMPAKIVVSIDKLNIGDSIKVGEIKTEKLTILDSARSLVVGVISTRNIEAGSTEEDEATAGS